MVTFPHSKINLGLHVLARRSDGYHNISTCFYPIPWTDVLEILPASKWEFHQTGISIPGKEEDNLCVKAYRLLQQTFKLPPVQVHLHKLIPTGAGLGGGSSDAAHTLLVLNSLFELKLSQGKLMSYALQLGSDCPFFVQEKPMMGSGRGENLEPVDVNLKGLHLVMLVPGIHISTAEAYKKVIPGIPTKPLTEEVQKPVASWKALLKNDFEAAAFREHPSILKLKEKLYSCGALYASMSGSGSAVYGIFDKEIETKDVFKEVSLASYWL